MADRITYPNKSTGNTYAATEATEVKTVVNSHATDLEALAISNEALTTVVKADAKRFPTSVRNQSGTLTYTSDLTDAVNSNGMIDVVNCDGSDIVFSGAFANYSNVASTAGQTIVITFVYISSLSQFVINVDPPIVTPGSSLIVFSDLFNSSTIDTSNWNVTDPSDSVSIDSFAAGVNGLYIVGDSTTAVNADVNKVDSSGKRTISTGTVQTFAKIEAVNYDASMGIFRFRFPATGGNENYIGIQRGAANSTDIRFLIMVNGVLEVDTTTGAVGGSVAYTSGRQIRLSYDGATAKIERWNGSAWVTEASHATATLNSGGDGYIEFTGGNNIGGSDDKESFFAFAYMTAEIGYSSVTPVS
jgi:hypothetical protein